MNVKNTYLLISLNFKCPMTRKWIKETITGFKISSFETKINHQIVKYTMYLSKSGTESADLGPLMAGLKEFDHPESGRSAA